MRVVTVILASLALSTALSHEARADRVLETIVVGFPGKPGHEVTLVQSVSSRGKDRYSISIAPRGKRPYGSSRVIREVYEDLRARFLSVSQESQRRTPASARCSRRVVSQWRSLHGRARASRDSKSELCVDWMGSSGRRELADFVRDARVAVYGPETDD